MRYNKQVRHDTTRAPTLKESHVNTLVLNALVAVAALVLLFTLWVGIHVLARRRMGERQIGCRGPVTDDFGNEVCCHTGEPCRGDSACDPT